MTLGFKGLNYYVKLLLLELLPQYGHEVWRSHIFHRWTLSMKQSSTITLAYRLIHGIPQTAQNIGYLFKQAFDC